MGMVVKPFGIDDVEKWIYKSQESETRAPGARGGDREEPAGWEESGVPEPRSPELPSAVYCVLMLCFLSAAHFLFSSRQI